MAFFLYIIYIIMAYTVSLLAIYADSFSIVFGYDDIVSVSDLFTYSFPLVIGCALFSLAYFTMFTSGNFQDLDSAYRGVSLNKKKALIDFFCIYIQLVLLIFILTKLAINSSMVVGGTGIVRYLSGKENYLLMILQSLLIFACSKRVRLFVIICVFLVSFIFAWFSGTREAIIPIASLVLYSALKNKKSNAIFFSIALLFIYSFVFVSRKKYVKFDLYEFYNSLLMSFDVFGDSLLAFLSYTLGYSLMHFSYVNMHDSGVFTLRDLIYSLTPLPSRFLPAVDSSLWRVDAYRPMGAYSELYRVSSLAFYSFVFFLGCLGKLIDNIQQKFVKSLLLVVFSLLIIMLFQYGMRTNLWFIVLIILVMIVNKTYERLRSKNKIAKFDIITREKS